MKAAIKSNESGFFTIKDEEWLNNQRIAGKVLSSALQLMKEKIAEGISTADINIVGETFILDNNCVPTFKGYNNFPAAACISIDKELVHGIPNTNRFLNNGEIVKIDCGATYKGAISDSAITCVVGEYRNGKEKDLVEGCRRSLDKAIDYLNNNIATARLHDIGNIIKKEASVIGATSVRGLTGHGLEIDFPHFFPFIFNYGNKGDGIKVIPNTTFCIEPMFIYGEEKLNLGDDKWTISTPSIGVHFEHTVYLHEDKAEIITK